MNFFSGKVFQSGLVLCFFILIFGCSSLDNISIKNNTMSTKKKSIVALLLTSNASFFDIPNKSEKNLQCRWLRGQRYQRKLCQQKKWLPEILRQTRELTLNACQVEFMFDHWNCSTVHMKKLFKKLYRETAFMHSLAASAFMYTIAEACLEGKLENCKCASHVNRDRPQKEAGSVWGGCSVNPIDASRFVEKFLQLKKKSDNPNNIMKHNSQVGLKIARRSTKVKCICHGLSGSCSQRVCFERLTPFSLVAKKLKESYFHAISVEPNNNIHYFPKYRKKKQLLYIDSLPNYCDWHKNWGISITGRQCRDVDNCATLCCSNGYVKLNRVKNVTCNCKWIPPESFNMKCDNCSTKKTEYFCS